MLHSEESSREDRLIRAIAACRQAIERGEKPDLAQFLAEHADLPDSANALAKELTRYLAGGPIPLRPVNCAKRFRCWCRRQPVVASLSAAVMVVLLVGTIISSHFSVVASNRAQEAAALADKQAELADRIGRLTVEKKKLADENGKMADAMQQLAREKGALAEAEIAARRTTERQLRIATAERLSATSLSLKSDLPAVSLALAIESGRATRHDDEEWRANSETAPRRCFWT